MERALSRAQALEAENPSAAESIRRGLAELYGDQPWAAELLKQAD
jgi:hypothetical protein